MVNANDPEPTYAMRETPVKKPRIRSPIAADGAIEFLGVLILSAGLSFLEFGLGLVVLGGYFIWAANKS